MNHRSISRTRYLQENRKMRFEEAYDSWTQGCITQSEAALLLGQCERSFRRHIERYEADGLEATAGSKPSYKRQVRSKPPNKPANTASNANARPCPA